MHSVYTNENTRVFHVRLPTCVRMSGNNPAGTCIVKVVEAGLVNPSTLSQTRHRSLHRLLEPACCLLFLDTQATQKITAAHMNICTFDIINLLRFTSLW